MCRVSGRWRGEVDWWLLLPRRYLGEEEGKVVAEDEEVDSGGRVDTPMDDGGADVC